MRDRKEIEKGVVEGLSSREGRRILEVLLDIRDLLTKPIVKQEGFSKEQLKELKEWEKEE